MTSLPSESLTAAAIPGKGTVAGGYALDGYIVSDLPREALPEACPPADSLAVERLDIVRYRMNGIQAWIRK